MAKYNYHLEEVKDLAGLYIYCDVFDYHFVRVESWKSGIALCLLERGMAIFNGQNGKSYIFEEDVPEDWVRDQFFKCVDKYSSISSYAASRIKFDNESKLTKLRDEIRARDY